MYQGLQSIISTTSLNLKEIETHWHEVLRLASSIKQGTVTASLMMKKSWQAIRSRMVWQRR
uniref:Transposase n=1 Tax=Klebsiella pneumoniae TaxID=573 RepID=A0A8B0SPI8_KLEPN|nr:Transposase [Klebsiella pneumoniae]